jgi:hypothetical protein
MNLARHSVSSVTLPTYNQVIINQDGDFFAVASGTGYEVWRLHPLENVARRGEQRLLLLHTLIRLLEK